MNNIPKTIHYCWFGNGQKSELIQKCIESWKQFFPDFEIIEWNESNFDVTQHIYCKEAYEHKKWAFVSDYARLAIIYQYGGYYFDTDVEVLKRFDDLVQDYGYLCFEHTSNIATENEVATGLGFAAKPHSEIVALMLKEYDNLHFVNNGEMDLTPCPTRNTNALLKAGLKKDGSMQIIGDIKIYPYEYFCGIDIANSHPHITENTHTVHHYSATWKNELGLKAKIIYKYIVPCLQKVLGYNKYDKLVMLKQKFKRKS